MNWFTSDWHLGETRLGIPGPNVFYRPFDNTFQNDQTIIYNFMISGFQNGDTLYHLGDVMIDKSTQSKFKLEQLKTLFPDSRFELIIGNYDEDKIDILEKYFDALYYEKNTIFDNKNFYLNHYPKNCIDKEFSLTGHIHGLWKVQKNIINVGVDAWHFKPVSEETILFCRNACEKYYDKNVFPY